MSGCRVLYDGDGGDSHRRPLAGPTALSSEPTEMDTAPWKRDTTPWDSEFQGATSTRGGMGRTLSPSGGGPQGSADPPRPSLQVLGPVPLRGMLAGDDPTRGSSSTPRPGTTGSLSPGQPRPRGQQGQVKRHKTPARPVPAEIIKPIKSIQTERGREAALASPRKRRVPRAAPSPGRAALSLPGLCGSPGMR